ncbi:MAG: transglutaminase domain-containing protein [Deltaproteobacteria bacterium]
MATNPRPKKPNQLKELWRALGPSFVPAVLWLSAKAFWTRIRSGRGPFAPTFPDRPVPIPKALRAGRTPSKEQYLRPTPLADSADAQITALADVIRDKASGDLDFARSAYDFVREGILFAIEPPAPDGVAGILRRGYGICFDKANVLVALARAGGIPARYCIISHSLGDETKLPPIPRELGNLLADWQKSGDWSMRNIGVGATRRLSWLAETGFDNSLATGLHTVVELKAGGSWIAVDPNWTDAEAVALGLPLLRFGYDPITMFGYTGALTNRSEAAPVTRGQTIGRRILCVLTRGTIDILNRTLNERREEGRRVLAEVGEDAYMQRMKRFYVPLPIGRD